MKKPIKAILISLGLVLLFFSVQFFTSVSAGITYSVSASSNGITPDPKFIQDSIMSHINTILIISDFLLLFILWIAFVIKRVKIKEYISFSKLSLKNLPVFIGISFLAQSLSTFLLTLTNYIHPIENSYNDMLAVLKSQSIFITIISAVILAPITEEILFRGIIFKKLHNNINLKTAIVIQAMLFSFVHFNLAQTLPTFLLGVVLAYMYYKTNNLWVPIFIHIIYNGLATFITNVDENMQTILAIGMHSIAVITVIYLIYLYTKKRKILKVATD
ncbi:CPBP family intramembrane glutamic endopeptidase [Helicovermis profundi]|uniref:Type II CAAX endopeptidase family protein n=1 Tax=Helicovermis profundi TaxID=3065157 RepID=A0AAU9EBH6_9FIRM|nr:type II CAAX endopeptidase family protein [Clostridia bacterium S502]